MKLLDRIRCRKLKGAVLFTVVSVCAVIIIFIMATLTVVATVQKRTYSDYAKSQSYYTARSAVNSVITALNEDSDISLAFKNISGRTPLTISMSDSADMGQITSIYADKITEDMYKICATARVLDDETTVAVYVYEGTKVEPASGSSSSSAITTFGVSNSNNLSFIGGGAINVYDENCPSGIQITSVNSNDLVGDLVINAGFFVDTSSKFILEKGQGVSIFGDFINDEGGSIIPTYNLIEGGATSYNGYQLSVTEDADNVKLSEMPYIYCTGEFNWFGQANNLVVGLRDEATNVYCPVNIFCGSFNGNVDKDIKFTASVYCYDATETSVIKAGNNFSLYGWIESLTQDGTTSQTLIYNGDFYTKGNLTIQKENANAYYFNGDLCVDGTLTVSGNNGVNIYVAGQIKAGNIVLANDNIKFYTLQGGTYTEVAVDSLYQTSLSYDETTLNTVYSQLGVAKGDWAALHTKLAASPKTATSIPSANGGNMTYQDLLDEFTFFSDDYEMKNVLSGYYYATDNNGNPVDDVIYHDDVQAIGEPANYVYQTPEGGFIRTVATIQAQFPVDETKSQGSDDTIYECETFSSPTEFDTVLKGGDYLYITKKGDDGQYNIRVYSASDEDITDVIENAGNLGDYYTVDGNKYTIKCNAKLVGTIPKIDFVIDPQAAGKDLYIMLEGCSYSNGGKIVVNDEKANETDKMYMCYMYASSGSEVTNKEADSNGIYPTTSLNINSNTCRIVSKYYDDFLNGGSSLYLEQFPEDERQIPNIYMYVQPYTHINADGGNVAITAYINAPRSSIAVDNGITGVNKMYYTTGKYDHSTTPPTASAYSQEIKNTITLLGSFVFGGASMKNSTVSYIYVSDDGRGDNDNPDDGNIVYTWQPLYYDSN